MSDQSEEITKLHVEIARLEGEVAKGCISPEKELLDRQRKTIEAQEAVAKELGEENDQLRARLAEANCSVGDKEMSPHELKRLKDALAECPWPEDVWTMTMEEYVQAVPDEALRTSISGLLARFGWKLAERHLAEQLAEITG